MQWYKKRKSFIFIVVSFFKSAIFTNLSDMRLLKLIFLYLSDSTSLKTRLALIYSPSYKNFTVVAISLVVHSTYIRFSSILSHSANLYLSSADDKYYPLSISFTETIVVRNYTRIYAGTFQRLLLYASLLLVFKSWQNISWTYYYFHLYSALLRIHYFITIYYAW